MNFSANKNIIKHNQTFHINSKNLPQEPYTTTVPGFWTLCLSILLRIYLIIFFQNVMYLQILLHKLSMSIIKESNWGFMRKNKILYNRKDHNDAITNKTMPLNITKKALCFTWNALLVVDHPSFPKC